MTKFADGDRVRATKDNNVLEGTLRYWEKVLDDELFDIVFSDDPAEFAQLNKTTWTLELIKPNIQGVLRDMKIGTRFIYPGSAYRYWIKVADSDYVYVTNLGKVGSPMTAEVFIDLPDITVLDN